MVKHRINATIKLNTYLKLKMMKIDNTSELIGNFLDYYTTKDNPNSKAEIKLKKLREEINERKEKIAIIEFNLNDKKEKISKEEKANKKKRIEQAVQLAKGIKASGILHED